MPETTTTPAAPSTRITNPKKRIIALNGSAGAYTLIACSKFCRYVEIQECAPAIGLTGSDFSPEGVNYTLPDDGFVSIMSVLPGAVLALGDQSWHRAQLFGVPPITYADGSTVAGTPIGKFISAQSGTTQVEVREWT